MLGQPDLAALQQGIVEGKVAVLARLKRLSQRHHAPGPARLSLWKDESVLGTCRLRFPVGDFQEDAGDVIS